MALSRLGIAHPDKLRIEVTYLIVLEDVLSGVFNGGKVWMFPVGNQEVQGFRHF